MFKEKWKGTYTLGKSYGKGLAGKRVEFTMELRINGEQISGYCQDKGEIEKVFDKPAVIEGSIKQGAIVFTKRYPGLLTADHKNYYAFSDLPSADIIYEGRLKTKFFSRNKYFEGTWKIKAPLYAERNKEVIIENKGTWRMQ